MVRIYIILVVLFVDVNGDFDVIAEPIVKRNQSAELEYLKTELNVVSKEISALNLNSTKLIKAISDLETNCDHELQQLKQKYEELLVIAEKKQHIMANLLQQIQDEEDIQIKLEEELRRISEVLELYEHQYQVVSSDLQLMEVRRKNGTSVWCTQLSHALATGNEETLLIRAHMASPYKARKTKSQEELEVMTIKRKLKINTTLKNTISAKLETLKKALTAQLELCKGRQSNVNLLIKESFLVNKVSDESVKSFTEDLASAKEFSNAVRVEIAKGKKLLENIKDAILIMKSKMEGYKSDYTCFSKIMAMD